MDDKSYIILRNESSYGLEDHVNSFIEDGYIPTGGVARIGQGPTVLCQAIYKEAPVIKESCDHDFQPVGDSDFREKKVCTKCNATKYL